MNEFTKCPIFVKLNWCNFQFEFKNILVPTLSQLQLVTKMQSRPLSLVVYFDSSLKKNIFTSISSNRNDLNVIPKMLWPHTFSTLSQLQLVTKMQSRPLSMVVYFDLCFPMISMTSHRQSSIKRQTLWQFQYSKIFIIFASHSQSGSYTVWKVFTKFIRIVKIFFDFLQFSLNS